MEDEQRMWSQAFPGLTGYATRVFIAMSRSYRATAAEIAYESGIPRQRVYDVLTDLVSRGVVFKRPGRPVQYEGIDPLDAANRLAVANRAALLCQEERMQSFAEELREQWLRAREGERRSAPPGRIEPTQLHRWASIATSSIAAMAPGALDDRDAEQWLTSLNRLIGNGGTARCLFGPDVRTDPRHLAQALTFAAAGQEPRVASDVAARWVVVDCTEAIIPLPFAPAKDGRQSFVLLEQRQVVHQLIAEFEALWQHATPLSLPA